MSIAGIRSNRGDGYQTLVAFDWALTVLADPDYQWLEIDSVTYSVDDVVIGKTDGTLIACQCKKNQLDFKAWTITDLADELDKASCLLASNMNAEVRFYSRSNFGALAKLREHSSTQSDETSYRRSLGGDHQVTDKSLSAKIATSIQSLSSYEFLCRTKFVTSDELDRMAALLRERLYSIASNPDAAFNALWVCLDQLGARMGDVSPLVATKHRLTKDDLRAILQNAGAMLSPPMGVSEVRTAFSKTSAIGRSWRRDIAGSRISSSTLEDLLVAIDAKNRAILLTGMPGSGKTCVMLALQEELEQREKAKDDIVPLFIQSRDFADLATSQDRQAQGLPEQWVENAARMADVAHVIVVIDSLDVLSIARDHRVLSYFLAQLDRLLLIQNVTVVASCRDFDRHYDRRIAERQWDVELKCKPLDWEAEIVPLFDALGITTTSIDAVTRNLISNPRELALFMDLARQEDGFNIVTSQHLAQRYLENTVRANSALGDTAMHAIETIADDMLKSRSLLVPNQRFTASQSILRELCSLNVLQETHDGKLALGHQTLLDVLVISGALRRGITLSDFICSLPPVPFVRPAIRSYIAQLALGKRREFRKQLRTILTGEFPFHIRRLVAEVFADYLPQDDDWPLLRDLHERYRDVFQVIYKVASSIEWHHFWLNHLVPVLRSERNIDELTSHAHHIAQWKNIDAVGVLSFWLDMLTLDWFDRSKIVNHIGVYLCDINPESIALVPPLLTRLLAIPSTDHDFLGRVIARCSIAGVADDSMLWGFIAGNISDSDLLDYRFNNKLRCNAHDFDVADKGFLQNRMLQSTELLDLAIESIERWSTIRASRYGEANTEYRFGFLGETSYENAHSKRDIRYSDSLNVLFAAVESAILRQAETSSKWWLHNRERLCFNCEGALRYFGILACTVSPETNIDLIGRILQDKNILTNELVYEIGSLIHSAFPFLEATTQSAVMNCILIIYGDEVENAANHFWFLKNRAELISTIPSFLRSSEAQSIVDAYVEKIGFLIRQPQIRSYGGMVSAPFSYEVFLNASDMGILSLLKHYDGHTDSHRADFLTGGEREVGWQLREASSRHPARFMGILKNYWDDISRQFRNDILDGACTFLDYRYGHLQADDAWVPITESDAQILSSLVLDELERHPSHWHQQRSTASALKSCANIILDTYNAERLVFISISFSELREDYPISGDNVDLLNQGINMAKGNVAEALITLITNLQKSSVKFPELLEPTLRRFARDENPAVRAVILHHLPYLQSLNSEISWILFHLAVQDSIGLWNIAERFLYFSYHNDFESVAPVLERIYQKGSGKDLETWGRISALAAMAQHIDFIEFIERLNALDSTEAWCGASSVWTHRNNIQAFREQCLEGIGYGLNSKDSHANLVACNMEHMFDNNTTFIPPELIQRCFFIFTNNPDHKHHQLHRFHEWLCKISQTYPMLALVAVEIYLGYVMKTNINLYDLENKLSQLLTMLFSEAEEIEDEDNGSMLQRVVAIQELLLSLGVTGAADWLKAAERP